MPAPELEIKTFPTQAAWRRWLRSNHAKAPGIWIQVGKKDNPQKSVTYAEAVDEALCWGWIDGQRKGLDDDWFLQRFTPRRARSIWSKVNVGKVAALTKAGRMQPAGQREVDAAKADGRWAAAYGGTDIPPELESALAANRTARAAFDALNAQNRYAMCFRVQTAKRPETKAARVEKFIAMLERGERLH